MTSNNYVLPSSLQILCEDRFSILDRDDDLVPFWDLLTNILTSQSIQDPSALIDALETIAVALRGTSGTDYGFLKAFLRNHVEPTFYHDVWPRLTRLALRMPELFPDSEVPILSESRNVLNFSREQIACLVIHQFLCTLQAPSWQEGFQDFDLWYDEEQPHENAVEAYLTALFTYFTRIASDHRLSPTSYSQNEWTVTYELRHGQQNDRPIAAKLQPLFVKTLPEASTEPDLLGLPQGASVISANKFIGFGRTGTQEETHVGASPESCPAVLFTPPLTDDQVLVVTGAEAIITITGYGRDARCSKKLDVGSADPRLHCQRWSKRTMLFMDALELDLADRSLGEPVDLQGNNVRREITKASKAFLAGEKPFKMIYTGFWGCKTFGGNPAIKAAIQWLAASWAASPMTFVCSGPAQAAFAVELERFVSNVVKLGVNAQDLEDALLALKLGKEGEERSFFAEILQGLAR